MHYYSRNIGDYSKKAGRLTMLEHGAYTNLLDSIYDREQFPTLEEALDWTWARSEAEIEAVKFVLSKFFHIDEEGHYIQPRVLEELEAYRKKSDTNRRIAQEREAKKKGKTPPKQAPVAQINEKPVEKVQIESQSVHESCTTGDEACTSGHLTNNHKPITNNQEPLTNTPQPPSDVTASTVTNGAGLSHLQVLACLKSKGVEIGKHGYLATNPKLVEACETGISNSVFEAAWDETVARGKRNTGAYFFTVLSTKAAQAKLPVETKQIANGYGTPRKRHSDYTPMQLDPSFKCDAVIEEVNF